MLLSEAEARTTTTFEDIGSFEEKAFVKDLLSSECGEVLISLTLEL